MEWETQVSLEERDTGTSREGGGHRVAFLHFMAGGGTAG